MATTIRNKEVSERLVEWIKDHYSARGKFTQLQKDSELPAQRWKDLYYGRQYASAEMLKFVESMSSREADWIRTGVRPPEKDGYPFLTSPPTKNETETISGRLVWVIKEWTSPRGAQLFSYLSERYNGIVSADDWASVILGKAEPSLEILKIVCQQQPCFAEWIITGAVNNNTVQVDPTNSKSIENWKDKQTKFFNELNLVLSEDLKNGDKEN